MKSKDSTAKQRVTAFSRILVAMRPLSDKDRVKIVRALKLMFHKTKKRP